TAQAQLPETGGLRIAQSDAQQGSLELSLDPEPQEDDHVIETGAARVFVDSGTAPVLENQSLDAQITDQGTGFSLTPQSV
ncbi:MAG: Fe-S cluster assembly protein HesB, partial [Cellulomonadaceae bacterium]